MKLKEDDRGESGEKRRRALCLDNVQEALLWESPTLMLAVRVLRTSRSSFLPSSRSLSRTWTNDALLAIYFTESRAGEMAIDTFLAYLYERPILRAMFFGGCRVMARKS